MGQFVSQLVQANSKGVYHLSVQPTSAMLLIIPLSSAKEDQQIIVSD